MKLWKIVLLAVACVLAIALIYPGVPAGVTLESHFSSEKEYAVLHCYYLHWTGPREKIIDVSSEIKNTGNGPSISMGKEPCFRWTNWDPMKSS